MLMACVLAGQDAAAQDFVAWTIASVPPSVYLRGEENTAQGTTRYNILCGPTPPLLLITVFEGGEQADEIAKLNALSLVIDKKRPRPKSVRRDVKDGLIFMTFRLDDALLAQILAAERVGVMLQLTYQSDFFHGFDSMLFAGGAAKWPEFMEACRRLRAAGLQ
jgi:hypothetical protein